MQHWELPEQSIKDHNLLWLLLLLFSLMATFDLFLTLGVAAASIKYSAHARHLHVSTPLFSADSRSVSSEHHSSHSPKIFVAFK
jgi:hypothetical protein